MKKEAKGTTSEFIAVIPLTFKCLEFDSDVSCMCHRSEKQRGNKSLSSERERERESEVGVNF